MSLDRTVHYFGQALGRRESAGLLHCDTVRVATYWRRIESPGDEIMITPARTRVAVAALLMVAASAARAQQPAAAGTPPPEVGSLAPDFALPGATRYGVLRDSVHLSDFRGKTVVLAFFYKARTKG